jgi:hypothetical protein
MMRLLHTTPIVLVALLLSASPAAAQRPTFRDRGYIVVNGGYQTSSNDFQNGSTFRANVEDGTFTTDYEVKGGPTLDIAGGVFLSRRLAVGAGVTRFSRSTPSTLTGSVPHPFFFNRPRDVTGDVAGIKREELAVHIQARAIAPINPRLQVMAFGGPSFFQVKQGMVTNFTWSEAYPFDAASFSNATTVGGKGSKVGFNVGADVAFFFSRQVGVGGTIQFSTATVDIDDAIEPQELRAGGLTAGGGLRLRF